MFEAVVNFNKALDNVPKMDVINQFMLNLSIAGMYSDYDFIDKAKYHVDVAYKLLPFDSIPEKYLNTLGVVEYKAGNFVLADKIFERAVQFANKQGRPEIIAPTYTNYANLRRREKKYDEAMDFLSKSDSISGVNGMQVGFLINRLNRTEIYYDQGLYDEALKELQLAYPDLIAYDVLNFNIAFHESLFKIYDKLGLQALADSNYRKFTEYQKKYKGDISLSAISEWELAAERERAIAKTNEVNRALEREVRIKYLIALILTILLLILSFSYFFIFRKRLLEREKFQMESVRLQKALEEKSKALLAESLNNLTIQNTKEEILLEIDEILARLPDKTKNEFSALTYRLRSGKDSNFLDEFESRFIGVYESFYEKLLDQAPELTPNELRVCAFMRLNMTSKDIARLTGKSTGTLDNIRTFIRKKLKLDSDVNLQKFLLEL
jgi:tetratricopeptide (TPR) repeat protein